MTNLNFDKENTALLVIDPYNDFVSEGGKVWDRIQRVAEANDCMPHMLQLVNAARTAGLPVFYALHHRYRPGDYQTWKYIAPIQKAAWSLKTFEYGTWGGEIHKDFAPQAGDVVVQEHWGSSGFANTDLDLQLRKHGVHKLIVIGLLIPTRFCSSWFLRRKTHTIPIFNRNIQKVCSFSRQAGGRSGSNGVVRALIK